MKHSSSLSFSGLWGLLWRSTVFLPFALVLFFVWALVLAAVFLLPVTAALYLYAGEWLHAVAAIALWIPCFFLSRWKRFHVSPKDDLNGNENI